MHVPAIAGAILASSSGLTAPSSPPVPIYGGQSVGPGQHEAVVAIETSGALCTGTVIAPTLVLTAAHCLYSITDPSDVQISFGLDLDAPAASVTASRIGYHPDFCSDCTKEPDIFDYGFVILPSAASVTGGFPTPITDQNDWDASMYIGATVTVVGFGEANVRDDGTPIPPTQRSDSVGIKRRVDVEIEDFTATGWEFLAGGNGKDSCLGDSGGPAFVEIDGKPRLAGVLSRGFKCGEGGFYGIPWPALEWLEAETGVPLIPSGCDDAPDCLDTSPSESSGRCSLGGEPPDAALGLVMLALLRRRSSRRR